MTKRQEGKAMKKSKKRRSVSKQGRKAVKSSKGAPSVPTNTEWDALDLDINEAMDYTLAQDKGNEGTDKTNEGTDRAEVSTDRQVKGIVEKKEQDPSECATPTAQTTTLTAPTMTSTPTPTIVFGNDETIVQVLITMSQNKVKLEEKEKGVELKDVEDIERPRPTSTRSMLTLRPLPKIDPKAKDKWRIEEEDESDTESEGITKAEKKFKQLANDEEVARKVQEEWEAEEEKKRLAEKEATKAGLINKYDFIQARLNADKILAEKLQEEDREMYTIEQRAKSDDNFIAIGSAEDERLIKEMNEQVAAPSKKRVKKDYSVKEKIKEEAGTRKRKLATRRKMKSKKRKFTSKAPDEDKEVNYEILDRKYPIIEWKSEYIEIEPQFDETKKVEEININVVNRSNGQKRFFSTLMRVLSIFDRDDLDVMSFGTHRRIGRYPLRKKELLQMLELKLKSEEDSTMALKLIRFVKKLIAELEPKNSDGDEDEL
ncbi:hypothetical protein Tco_0523977 [Tanacetum coccineum]